MGDTAAYEKGFTDGAKGAPLRGADKDIKGPGIVISNLRIGKGYNLDIPEMRGFATGSDVLAASDDVSITFYPRLQQYMIVTPARPNGVLVDTSDCSADIA